MVFVACQQASFEEPVDMPAVVFDVLNNFQIVILFLYNVRSFEF